MVREERSRGVVEDVDERRVGDEIRADIVSHFESETVVGSDEHVRESYLRDEFFDFSFLEAGEVVEAYWVNKPYTWIAILFDEHIRDHRYFVIEPSLSETEQYVRNDLERILRNVWRDRSVNELSDEEGKLSNAALEMIFDEHAQEIDPGPLSKLYYYFMRDFAWYGPIDGLMRDPNIEDISCDGHEIPVYIYHQEYRDLETNIAFPDDWLNDFTVRLAQRAGDYLTVATPRGGGMLPDGSRIQMTLGPDISDRGSNFTIRKFQQIPFTPLDLISFNTFSVEQMAYLWFAIEHNISMIFVGPTASGKTTSMNAVSLFLPPNEKVVTVEQIREISIPHNNWIASVTRDTTGSDGRGDIGMYDLLEDALHQRPEYLIVGEIRTNPDVVRTFFHATFTGHPGGTTFHARDSESAVDRLMSEPLNVPPRMINAIDIISVQRQVIRGDERVRRNFEISEVRMPDDELQTIQLFEWDPYTDSFDHAEDLYGQSQVLREIAEDRGWDELQINEELYQRRTMLQYLIEHDHTEYEEVIATLQLFSRDREFVLERIREDRFDPTGYEPDNTL